MNKNCKLTIGAMLLLTTAFSVAEVRAQTCVVPPTCEGLGYDKTASDCGGLAKLRCPFDDSKYFCTAYRNPDGSAPVTVGDIVYSDGTYANPEIIQPNKTPIGVIYNSNGGYFVALDDFGSFSYNSTLSCSKYTVGASTWSVPTENQLKEMYKNITTLNTSIDLFAKTRLQGKYAYAIIYPYVYYVDMSTGQSDNISSSLPTRCVNTLANIKGNTTLKVGDQYVAEDGTIMGTVVELDASGKHGVIAQVGGVGTKDEATAACISKATPKYPWRLATMKNTCTLLQNVGSFSGNYEMTCGAQTSSVAVVCSNGEASSSCIFSSSCTKNKCTDSSSHPYVCETSF